MPLVRSEIEVMRLRKSMDGFCERGGEMSIEMNNPCDVVVELSNESNISGEIVRSAGLMILIDLIDEQPVLVQYLLNLNKTPLETLHHLPIQLHPLIAYSCT